MSTILKVKQIITDAISLVVLIPAVIVGVFLLVLFNGLLYEIVMIFLPALIVGSVVLHITKWTLLIFEWIYEQNSNKYLIRDSTIDSWADRAGIASGGLVLALYLLMLLGKVYTALKT